MDIILLQEVRTAAEPTQSTLMKRQDCPTVSEGPLLNDTVV